MDTHAFRGRASAMTLAAFLVVMGHSLSLRAGGKTPEETLTLEALITLPEEDLAQVDIAAMNPACCV